MKVNVKLTGGQDLVRRLRERPAAVGKRTQLNALRKAAEPMRATMEQLAPRDEQANAPHLADNIVVGDRSLTKAGEGEVIVEVGPQLQPSDHFYGFFQEFGTAFHPATPFARPAFDQNTGKSLNIVLAEMWTSIRKFLGSGGRSTSGRGA
jgi:HK97 gp10 family phage protein